MAPSASPSTKCNINNIKFPYTAHAHFPHLILPSNIEIIMVAESSQLT